MNDYDPDDSSSDWNEAINYAKEELGVCGYVDEYRWHEVVELAKEFLHDEFCDRVIRRYENHIDSRDWYVLRKAILKRDKHKCKDCGGEATTVHHLSYFNMKTINEKNDCISLCARCHSFRHRPGYIYKNSNIWISRSSNGFHTVYFCNKCETQRTFSSTTNPGIFKCDHCKDVRLYSPNTGGFS
jgi:hypothetical protein